MRSAALLVIIAVVAPTLAQADDDSTMTTVRVPRRIAEQQEPMLHLELPTNVEGIGGTQDSASSIWELGPRARLQAEGTWWRSGFAPDHLGGLDPSSHLDNVARGWRAGAQLTYDLGPFKIGAYVSAGHVDSRLETGTYHLVGIAIFKTFRLSKWMHAWISLGAGVKTWVGQPPPGEQNDATVTLSIGTTFR